MRYILHFVIVSLLILVSVILNSYTVTHLTRQISRRRAELRRLRWKYDEVRYRRYAVWPRYLREIVRQVR
ncbi:MAG: hypothetical protein GXO29_06085 [Thermotogae bacterium]|nr:hypothetical protein [Thermotogota bacterium]